MKHAEAVMGSGAAMGDGSKRTVYYGKGDVWVYRTYAKSLAVPPIPESAFTGKDNVLFGMNIKVAVSGEAFLPSFTEGDNSAVVATDSMKNFILRHAGSYEGATAEGFMAYAARCFLEKYPQMSGVRMEARQIPFDALPVPQADGPPQPGSLVYRYSNNASPTAVVELVRGADDSIAVSVQQSGVTGLKLIKVKGSSFTGYVRDEYTTLAEASDRPLFIFLDIHWRYGKAADAFDADQGRYAPAEQVHDIAAAVFHEMNSPSIQNLIWHIGRRILQRFPQLEEVWFESNNRTWDTVLEAVENGNGKVFTEPRPPYGFQGFSLTRADIRDLEE
ncbi:factor-independent urate hydroxylase [Paenibacillus turpanensis]|uniref:factor-independent urate hydroxylase n=1 Tax=Paenibacillus turpanensis TaxID=2689078 RepID=UPI001FB6651B|nr:urate oxidase [Paenibacillus turpanensis]